MTAHAVAAIDFDPATWTLGVHGNLGAGLAAAAVVGLVFATRYLQDRGRLRSFEINSAHFCFGGGRVTLKPNTVDRQVAYEIWVELATRKIGLPIALDDDVVTEIYDSWHAFFGVTRELIKTIPVTRATSPSTRAIIRLSIEVLNQGLRPHLTMWQARFRHWSEGERAKPLGCDPQELQKRFPRWAQLSAELLAVNDVLIAYRRKMEEIVYGAAEDALDGPLGGA